MTKIRFFTALFLTFVLFALACYLSAGLTIYADPLSLIFSVVVPYLIASFIYTPTEQKELIGECFKGDSEGNDKLLNRAEKFFRALKSLVIASTVATSLMGIIGLMANLADKTMIGPNLAVALICPFYSLLFILIVIEPMRATAAKKLIK